MKKICIVISPKKNCYAVSLQMRNTINNWNDTIKKRGLCDWLTIMDIWSLTNLYYIDEKTPKTYFEFPINLYSFLYSEDFDKCIYKWYSKREVEIIKHNVRKD